MACNCKKGGGHMAPAPKPKDTSKVQTLEKKDKEGVEEKKDEEKKQ